MNLDKLDSVDPMSTTSRVRKSDTRKPWKKNQMRNQNRKKKNSFIIHYKNNNVEMEMKNYLNLHLFMNIN